LNVRLVAGSRSVAAAESDVARKRRRGIGAAADSRMTAGHCLAQAADMISADDQLKKIAYGVPATDSDDDAK